MDGKRCIALVEDGSDPGPGQLIRYQFANHLCSISLELDDYARMYAEQGNCKAAELAESYLCTTCHILTKVHPRGYNLRGYVNA